MLSDALKQVMAGGTLSEDESYKTFLLGLSEEADPVALGGLLVALAKRGEALSEIVGAARALRERATPFEHDVPDAIDTCGTGGDGLGTFNISTTVAIVAAACGAPVIKHGNRAVSSSCGSADLLEAAGVVLELNPEAARTCLQACGITFLFAPNYHPAMRFAGPVRRALKIRTIFNLLGPLANPGFVKRQVLGVSDPRLVETHASTLASLGAEHSWVVHGAGGADEFTLAGPNSFAEVRAGVASPKQELSVEDYGLQSAPVSALAGGGRDENLKILKTVLDGEASPIRDAVLFNTAAALMVGGRCTGLDDGIRQAAQALDSGGASSKLTTWIETTQKLSTRSG